MIRLYSTDDASTISTNQHAHEICRSRERFYAICCKMLNGSSFAITRSHMGYLVLNPLMVPEVFFRRLFILFKSLMVTNCTIVIVSKDKFKNVHKKKNSNVY